MTNLKSNLRKVATIIACLTVATMFASCGGNKDNDDDENGGGKTNSKLVGTWTRHDISPLTYFDFTFNKDGTFFYLRKTTAEYSYKGNYSVSDGKIYFTKVVFTNGEYKADEPNSHAGYEIVVDKDGDQLRLDSSVGKSFMGATTWRRAK